MRKLLIAGNWKMNGDKAEAVKLLAGIKAGVADSDDIEWVVFPPFVYLAETEKMLAGSNIAWGGQNLSADKNGAFTGETSASMLRDFASEYVLVGHSERRIMYAEDDRRVAAKFDAAITAGLKPILCVGETYEERKAGVTEQVVNCQLGAILALEGGADALRQAVIAYEPVWAIGTGLTATPEEAQAVHLALRQQVEKDDEEIAKSVRILYGGSVKASNAAELFAQPDIDGALVGGASLDVNEFLSIGQLCNSLS